MKVIGIKENDHYAGFTLTDNLQEEYDNYANTPLTVIELGTGEDEVARNLVDYFTMNGEIHYSVYNLTDNYTLIEDGIYVME